MCIYVATKGTSFFTLLRMAGPSAVRRVAWISPSTSKGRLVRGLIFRVGGFFVSVQADRWHILGSWNLWKQIESPSVWNKTKEPNRESLLFCSMVSACFSGYQGLWELRLQFQVKTALPSKDMYFGVELEAWTWQGGKGGKGRYSMHPWWASLKNSRNIYYTVSSLSAKLVFSVLNDSILGSNSWQLQIEKIAFQTKSLGCCVSILLVFQNGPSNLQQAFPPKKAPVSFSMNWKTSATHTHTPGKLAFWLPKMGGLGGSFAFSISGIFPERTTSTSQRPRNAWCSFRSRRSDRSIQEVFAKKCCEGLCFLWGISLKIVND